MNTSRYICIHGHFYQPARENPWTGQVDLEPGAYPFHDWNERIAAECYSANAWSQIRDSQGQVLETLNNYERISFNFGPTLLAWMDRHAHRAYEAVLAADKSSSQRFSGHGSAVAQCYNHIIMPLSNRRDKVTQVHWGCRDFVSRFRRDPEGMWLPETAVDLETLDILAGFGIKFTILAPHQIEAVRALDSGDWKETRDESAVTTSPYLVKLASGRSIAVYVYDGEIARAVAFERLLNQGEDLAARLRGGFNESLEGPQLVHIATDGESYGHHHKFGDMALASALKTLEGDAGIRLTNYGEFLQRHPPDHEARIRENTSWSCAHGLGRWQKDCGCNTGAEPGSNQRWRAPLREALNWLRDTLMPRFEERGSRIFQDPWAARAQYLNVILGADLEHNDYWKTHLKREATSEAREVANALLVMQRHLMLMFSSCGWFFDDLNGVEARMSLRHAARVVELSRQSLDFDPESHLLEILRRAKPNGPGAPDGAMIYRQVADRSNLR